MRRFSISFGQICCAKDVNFIIPRQDLQIRYYDMRFNEIIKRRAILLVFLLPKYYFDDELEYLYTKFCQFPKII